ncbi:response regulator transcription factor [Paludibacterium sp. B53371]|uniref:response regulator transcription factor n=1 Tax=Paludibacterium sp. B53371 TaxID=2806263 RepID=UPI001C03B84B|nr:response regulator [Paludibacterium sp. B53371]
MGKKILLVDDDDLIAIQLEAILGEDFVLAHAATASDGLVQARTMQPDMILLDVQLADLDGYSVCRRFKAEEGVAHIPVIFVSARTGLEDRLRGYEAGGQDYITKPFSAEELREKLKAMQQYIRQQRALQSLAQAAAKTANVALESAGDAGRILGFLRRAATLHAYPALAEAALSALSDYQLTASIQLRSREASWSFSHHGPCSPLEVSVLSNMANQDRIVDLGSRSAFNYPAVTLIIDNMPTDEPERYARIKDVAAMLAESVDIRMSTLGLYLATRERSERLLQILEHNSQVMTGIEQHHGQQRHASEQILGKLVKDIEDAFLHLGLSERQEFELQRMTRDAVQSAQDLYQDKVDTAAILHDLQQAIAQVKADLASDVLPQPVAPKADDIELF